MIEQVPGRDRSRIEAEIAQVKRTISEVEALGFEERFPELIKRPNDAGLPSEQYKAWQNLEALRIAREELAILEKELKGK